MRRTIGAVCRVVAALAVTVSGAPRAAEPSAAAEAIARAREHQRAQEWAEAEADYREAVRLDPAQPWIWYILGTMAHRRGDYDASAAAMEQALEHKVSVPGVVSYNLACAYARLGRTEDAFEQLEQAAASALFTSRKMREDEDLASLRGAARFVEIARQADRAHHPCEIEGPHRAFDYWVGEWDVFVPGGFKAADDVVVKTDRGCVVRQDWKGVFGVDGESFSYYDPAVGQWVQTWIGANGVSTTFTGNAADGVMTLAGEVTNAAGQRVLARTRWKPETGDRIAVESESSSDGGTTWTPTTTLTYVRKPATSSRDRDDD